VDSENLGGHFLKHPVEGLYPPFSNILPIWLSLSFSVPPFLYRRSLSFFAPRNLFLSKKLGFFKIFSKIYLENGKRFSKMSVNIFEALSIKKIKKNIFETLFPLH